jgi:hypothetical protein
MSLGDSSSREQSTEGNPAEPVSPADGVSNDPDGNGAPMTSIDDSDDRRRLSANQAKTVARVERRLSRVIAELTRNHERIDELEDDRAKLTDDLALARWKLSSTTSRKWWRIGIALGRARSSLRRLLLLPFDLVRIVIGHSYLPPRPQPQRVRMSASEVAQKPPAEEARVFQNIRSRSTGASANAVYQDGVGTDSPLMPLLIPAPSSMSLAPPPVSTTSDLRVACVLDEMSYQSFKPECHLIAFGPHNWLEVLEREMPNLLLVESAWRGNGGSWEYKVGSYSYPESVGLPDLAALVEWCRREGIPTVFWNKEDPIHFEKFKEAAAVFDVVFTSDANIVERYQELPGVPDRVVGVLPFAAQPAIHNPVAAMGSRDRRPVFAGAYYRNRHESRRTELDLLLDAAMPHGLVIYDRMGGAVSDSFGFPDRFQPNVAGSLPYEDMVQVYRQHRVFLNVNSVNDSPTMFSRRVFELLASGTPVVSTPSLGVERIFGSVVDIVETPSQAEEAIRRLVEDDDWWLERSIRGIEAVFQGNTYADRLETIAVTAGLPVESGRGSFGVVLGANASVSAEALAAVDRVAEILSLSDSPIDGSAEESRDIRRVDIPADTAASDVGRVVASEMTADWLAFVNSDADLAQLPSLTMATRITPAELFIPASRREDMHRYVNDASNDGAVLVSRNFVLRTGWSPWDSSDGRAEGARVYAVPTFDA